MEEAIKTRIILILSVVIIMLLLGNVNSCSNARRQKDSRDKEMATRLDAEEKTSKLSHEVQLAEQKLKVREKELEVEKAAHQATKESLSSQETANQKLQEELEKVTKLKEALEQDLKEALVSPGNVEKATKMK